MEFETTIIMQSLAIVVRQDNHNFNQGKNSWELYLKMRQQAQGEANKWLGLGQAYGRPKIQLQVHPK